MLLIFWINSTPSPTSIPTVLATVTWGLPASIVSTLIARSLPPEPGWAPAAPPSWLPGIYSVSPGKYPWPAATMVTALYELFPPANITSTLTRNPEPEEFKFWTAILLYVLAPPAAIPLYCIAVTPALDENVTPKNESSPLAYVETLLTAVARVNSSPVWYPLPNADIWSSAAIAPKLPPRVICKPEPNVAASAPFTSYKSDAAILTTSPTW